MRPYDHYCGLARALDVVGDRWTLLIVRELLVAPRRYGELLDGLPGIATNLLADRLHQLEAAGVVTRAGPARGGVYALTDRGQDLEPAVLALARWGGPGLLERASTDQFRPHWLVVGLRSLIPARRDAGPDIALDLEVEGGVLHVRAGGGTVEVGAGPASEPGAAVVLAGTGDAVLGVAAGVLDFTTLAVRRGQRREVERARRLLVPARPLVQPLSPPA